ncbi:hypothetical protein OHJ16_15870, partial [Actinomyces israelii]
LCQRIHGGGPVEQRYLRYRLGQRIRGVEHLPDHEELLRRRVHHPGTDGSVYHTRKNFFGDGTTTRKD